MKKIDIQITKAILKSFNVELKEKKPVVSASIALLTEGGKAITEYSISTDSWSKENEFELPVECIAPIVKLAQQLETVVTKHCRDSQLALPANVSIDDIPTVEGSLEANTDDFANPKTRDSDVILDEPIDLSDIPF